MPAQTNRLQAKQIMSKPTGRYPDGNGLYLVVGKGGGRNWSLVFSYLGKQREMGLGSPPDVGLGEARDKAVEAKRLAKKGIDPIAERKAAKAPPPLPPLTCSTTFGTFADLRIEEMAPRWESTKTRPSWENSIRNWAAPIRNLPLNAIEVDDVLRCLKPSWSDKPIVVQSAQERIEQVLDAAIALKLRSAPNPAAWKNNLAHILPPKVGRKNGPHRALPYEEAPAFFARLSQNQGLGTLALRFTILTAVRSAQATQAKWKEIDFEGRLWRVPLERVKIRKVLSHNGFDSFIIPLSEVALSVLERCKQAQFGTGEVDPAAWIFPGEVDGKALSNGTMERVLDRAGMDVTVHGFRSTFRDWAGEKMIMVDGVERRAYSEEGCEIALGHVVGDAARRAYRRGQALRERAVMMKEWGEYLMEDARGSTSP
jgi:integrase